MNNDDILLVFKQQNNNNNCRREAYGLHADIVMNISDISSKTGRIRTKLSRGMGNGETVML